MGPKIMMTIIQICISILVFSQTGEKAELTNKSGDRIESIRSKILNEERNIWIYIPVTYNNNPQLTFPVIYLLDGEEYFYSVKAILQQLSEANMNMVLPQMIIVGISNTDRTRDFTPTHVTSDPKVPDSNFLKTSGGAGEFTKFLEKELFPYIDSTLPAAPFRILIGHSFGGLFCVNTLIHNSKLFNGYIAIDPSMDWDKKLLIKLAEQNLKKSDLSGISFFLSIANQGYSDSETFKDNAAAFELADILDKYKNNKFRFKKQYYSDDNHGSVPLISQYDGLRYIFDFYNPRIPYNRFRDPNFSADSFIISHFNTVSSNMGYRVKPPEYLINWFGYLFIMEKQYRKAYKLFLLNIENYPASFNAYDSMGEILMLMDDTTNSIKNYEKSLELNPDNENAKKMINLMKNKLR